MLGVSDGKPRLRNHSITSVVSQGSVNSRSSVMAASQSPLGQGVSKAKKNVGFAQGRSLTNLSASALLPGLKSFNNLSSFNNLPPSSSTTSHRNQALLSPSMGSLGSRSDLGMSNSAMIAGNCMDMALGDHFLVPNATGSVKVGLGWDHCSATTGSHSHVDVDASAILLNGAGKKVDHVSFGRRASRDHTVLHLGDEKGHEKEGDDESIIMHLDRISKEVQLVMVLLNVYTQSKTLDDVSSIMARVAQLEKRSSLAGGSYEMSVSPDQFAASLIPQPGASKYVETTELCKYTFLPTRTKLRGIVFLTFQRRSAQPGESQWKVIATGTPVTGRSHRHVTTECEVLAAKYKNGWLPRGKGYRTGGEIDSTDKLRLRAQQLRRRSTVLAALEPEDEIFFTGHEDENSTNLNASGESSDDSALDTMTPDELDEAMRERDVYQYQRGTKSRRSRVIRKAKRVYSVGRGRKGISKFDPDEDEDGSDQDEELFLTFFPGYGHPGMMRYADRCYNTGTEKDQLLAHYMRHQENFKSQEATLAQQRHQLMQAEQRVAEKPLDDSSSSDDEEKRQRKALLLGASGFDAEAGHPLPNMVDVGGKSDRSLASAAQSGMVVSILKPSRAASARRSGAASRGGGGRSMMSMNPSFGGSSVRRPAPPPMSLTALSSNSISGMLGNSPGGPPNSPPNSPPAGNPPNSSPPGSPAWLKQAQSRYQNYTIPASQAGGSVGGGRARGRSTRTSAPGRSRGARPRSAGSPLKSLNLNHLLSGDLKKWVSALLLKQEESKVLPTRNGRLPNSNTTNNETGIPQTARPSPPLAAQRKSIDTVSQTSTQQAGSSGRDGPGMSPEGAPWDNPSWPPPDPFRLKDDEKSLHLSRNNSQSTQGAQQPHPPSFPRAEQGQSPASTVSLSPESERPPYRHGHGNTTKKAASNRLTSQAESYASRGAQATNPVVPIQITVATPTRMK